MTSYGFYQPDVAARRVGEAFAAGDLLAAVAVPSGLVMVARGPKMHARGLSHVMRTLAGAQPGAEEVLAVLNGDSA